MEVQITKKILAKLESIDERLKELEKLEEIEESCSRMNEHITFVDSVYAKLRSPLDWLVYKITGRKNRLPPHSSTALAEGTSLSLLPPTESGPEVSRET